MSELCIIRKRRLVVGLGASEFDEHPGLCE
jgi:hypothetical protein